MSSLGYYVVMVFFAALFTKAFSDSNIGALIALEGADALRALALPGAATIVGVVLLTAGLDLVVPSASAKWALLAFCRRYVTNFGMGTLMSLVLPLGVVYLVVQTGLLLLWWALGLPLGIGARYFYP
jgi:aminobenzoyl-glutamate transport protein